MFTYACVNSIKKSIFQHIYTKVDTCHVSHLANPQLVWVTIAGHSPTHIGLATGDTQNILNQL